MHTINELFTIKNQWSCLPLMCFCILVTVGSDMCFIRHFLSFKFQVVHSRNNWVPGNQTWDRTWTSSVIELKWLSTVQGPEFAITLIGHQLRFFPPKECCMGLSVKISLLVEFTQTRVTFRPSLLNLGITPKWCDNLNY